MKNKYYYLLLTALLAGPALAQNAEERHDGVYANVNLGLGYGGYSATAGSDSQTATGIGFQYGGKLGFALSNNFILFGALDGYSVSNPTVKTTVGSSTTTQNTSNASVSKFMFGGGLGFYSDSNFFILGTIGVATGSVSQNSVSVSSNAGFGVNLNIGTEWWVAKDFAVGFSIVGNYSSLKFSGSTADWGYYYIGLAASATYN